MSQEAVSEGKMRIMNKKRLLGCVCALAVFAGMLGVWGCSGNSKPEIEVALWNLDVYENYTRQVQELVPDIKIKWVKGQRDLEYYRQLSETDSLPDIITVRKFSMKDSLSLNPYLRDLTRTEIASAYYDIYLENYKTREGKVFWVPMSGTVDGIVANKELFEEYGIPLPSDFDSFISACQAFEKHGIRGYSLDLSLDYNALHLLQGMGIESLSSVDGIIWRKDYEDGKTDRLDGRVWLPAFERMERLNTLKILDRDTMYSDDILSYERFMEGTQAMVNISSESISKLLPGKDIEILPYFGEEQDFLMTYPTFNAAISKGVEESSVKQKAAWEVLMAMTSSKAQEALNEYTDGLISYKRDISFEYDGCMRMVQPYLERNRTYIRLGSEGIFEASRIAVDEMLENHMSAEDALDLMSDLLSSSE